jgi:O-antigen/teichoic acid export membrane protein
VAALKHSASRAVAWTLAARQTERIFGIVSIAVLARLLSPGDFGLVAMAASIAVVVEVLSAFGFDWALIRLPDAQPAHYHTAWTLGVLCGFLILALLCAAAYPAAVLFGRPAVMPIMVMMGVNGLLGTLGNVWMAEYRRINRFDQEFKLNMAARVAGFLTSIIWAAVTHSYWALVFGTTAYRLALAALSYGFHRRRPRWDLSRAADLLHFSGWLLAGNVTEVLRVRFAAMWIGRQVGSREVGLYSMAQELAALASTELAEPVNRALFANYSQLKGDVVALRGIYLRVSGVIWCIGMPAAAGIALCAPDIVAILLGGQWSNAAGILRILTAANIMSIMAANTHYVYWALGRSRFVAMLSIAGAFAFVSLTLLLGRYHGIIGVAWAQVAASAFVLLVNFTVLARTLDLTMVELVFRNHRVVLASAAMCGIVLCLREALGSPGHWGLLAASVVAGVAGYFGALLALWRVAGGPPGPEAEIRGLAMRMLCPDHG